MSTPARDFRWVPRDDDFAMRLAMVRQRMGWNAKEAALACGFPQASWREWEVFHRVPRNLVSVADAIALRTGVDDYWLITGRSSDEAPSGPVLVRPEGFEPPTFWFGASPMLTCIDGGLGDVDSADEQGCEAA